MCPTRQQATANPASAKDSWALRAAVLAWDLLKEVTIIFIASTIVWPQVKQQEGNTACPSTANWIKDLLNMVPPIRIRPSFPLSQSLPSASYPFPLEGRQTENQNHRKVTKLITWTTALSSSMKLWAMLCRATQDRQVMVESSDKTWPTGEGNGKALWYYCLRTPWAVWKGKKVWHWKMNSQYTTGDQWRNNSRKNEETETKEKRKTKTSSCRCDWWWN